MVLVAMLGLSACGLIENEKRPAEVVLAEKLLQEKYNEEFVVHAMGGRWGTLTNNTFTVTCSPKSDLDLKFKAEIRKDGSTMYDEYVSRRVSAIIEEALVASLHAVSSRVVIKVGAVDKIIESSNSHLSLEEYLELKGDSGRFVVYTLLHKDALLETSGSALYDIIYFAIASLPKLNGSLRFYLVDDSTLDEVVSYLKENANIDSRFDDMVKGSVRVTSGITDGGLTILVDEFISKLGH